MLEKTFQKQLKIWEMEKFCDFFKNRNSPKVDKSLDKFSGKTLFAEKIKEIEKILIKSPIPKELLP